MPRNSASLSQHVAAEVLALEDVEVRERDGRRDRVAAEREAVGEHLSCRCMNGSAIAVGDDHRAHRRVRRGQALGGRDDVRQVAEALEAEVVAEPAPRADDLVGDQQHAVAGRRSRARAGSSRPAARSSRRRSAPARGSPPRPSRVPRTGSAPRSRRRPTAGRGPRASGSVGVRARGSRPAASGSNGVRSGVMPVAESAPKRGAVVGELARDHLVRGRSPRELWYWRASLSADSTASEPPEVKKTRLRSPGASEAMRAASSIAVGWA